METVFVHGIRPVDPADTTIISYVTQQGKPVFTLSGINGIINQYTVTSFEKAFPSSRFGHRRKVKNISKNNLGRFA